MLFSVTFTESWSSKKRVFLRYRNDYNYYVVEAVFGNNVSVKGTFPTLDRALEVVKGVYPE